MKHYKVHVVFITFLQIIIHESMTYILTGIISQFLPHRNKQLQNQFHIGHDLHQRPGRSHVFPVQRSQGENESRARSEVVKTISFHVWWSNYYWVQVRERFKQRILACFRGGSRGVTSVTGHSLFLEQQCCKMYI